MTLQQKVEALSGLQENWDSYGARPLPQEVITSAYCYAAAIEQYLAGRENPAVVPVSKGALQFEWHTNGRDLEIEVGKRVTVYTSVPGADREYEIQSPAEVEIPLSWLFSQD